MTLDKTCLVCKRVSNGMHFGAMTCRACAAFFRRATVLKLQYLCKRGESICDVDGRGRYTCRKCRLIKCREIGMSEDKIQLDYDPTFSLREIVSEREESSVPDRKRSPDLFFSPNPPQSLKIDFSDLIKRIERQFQFENDLFQNEGNELETLTKGLQVFRKNQKPSADIKFPGEVDIKYAIDWLNNRIFQYATWFSTSKTLMSLSMKHKMQLFRSSWSALRTFERIEMSVRIFEEKVVNNRYILMNDNEAMMLGKTYVDLASMSNYDNEYFQTLFSPFFKQYLEEVAKPLLAIKPTTEEVVFCMIHLIDIDRWDISVETGEACERLKSEIADQMHVYYTNHTVKMYSLRLLALMKIVKAMRKISREKSKIKEMFWLFDIFRADVSEPYFFEMF